MKLTIKYLAAICVDEKGEEHQLNLYDLHPDTREAIIKGEIKSIVIPDSPNLDDKIGIFIHT
jgi:hypothetical protein